MDAMITPTLDMERLAASDRKPTIPEVAPLIRWYYAQPGVGNGGSLHITLEDGNIDRGSVEFCRDHAKADGDYCGELLARILLRMSRTQRHRLYRMSFYPNMVGVV